MRYSQVLGLCAMSGLLVSGHPLSDDSQAQSSALSPRDNPMGGTMPPSYCNYGKTVKTGTSNKLVQISGTLPCGAGSGKGGCEVSLTQEHTFGVEVNFGLGGELSKAAGAIGASIGVSLSESWTTGMVNICSAGEDEHVCIWANIPYVNVDLSERKRSTLPNAGACTNPEAISAKIPLHQGGNDGFYCVRGKTNCHVEGSYYWVENQ